MKPPLRIPRHPHIPPWQIWVLLAVVLVSLQLCGKLK